MASSTLETRKPEQPLTGALLSRLFMASLWVLLFVPKINVFGIGGMSIQAKPEDILWILMAPLIVITPLSLKGWVPAIWATTVAYIAISAAWHPTNAALAGRLIFYSFPLLLAMQFDEYQRTAMRNLTRRALYVLAVIAVLQILTPFPAMHTGELVFGPIERASGFFGNGVEFALVALFVFWLCFFLGELSMLPWLAAVVIAFTSGTRFVALLLIAGGLVYATRVSTGRLVAGMAAGAMLAAAVVAAFYDAIFASRLADVDPWVIIESARTVISSASASTGLTISEGYCFEFDDSLSEDQSFAMRLSKLLFVLQNVVFGAHRLGFGLGQCIGDAGDNLYVRVLSDAGLPYLALVLALYVALLFARVAAAINQRSWLIFVFSLIAVSAFYDVLYFSRVAPFLFATLAIALRAPASAGRSAGM